MKKNTTKKVKAKSASKSTPAAKKSSVSLKDKKPVRSKSHTVPVSPARKIAVAAPTKKASRKSAVAPPAARTAPAQVQQKGISRNGKQLPENDRKAQKSQAKIDPIAKKSVPAPPPPEAAQPVKTYLIAKELKEFKGLLLAKRAALWKK